jgi:general secretion pathway protein C
VGVQVSGIKDGSVFQELGIQNGEVITQLNGIQIDSPESSAEVMLEFAESSQFSVTVDGPNGPRTLTTSVPR